MTLPYATSRYVTVGYRHVRLLFSHINTRNYTSFYAPALVICWVLCALYHKIAVTFPKSRNVGYKSNVDKTGSTSQHLPGQYVLFSSIIKYENVNREILSISLKNFWAFSLLKGTYTRIIAQNLRPFDSSPSTGTYQPTFR